MFVSIAMALLGLFADVAAAQALRSDRGIARVSDWSLVQARRGISPMSEQPELSLTVGASHLRTEDDGRTTSTPFEASYAMGVWRFSLGSDGYVRSRGPDGRFGGLADLNLTVDRQLKPEGAPWAVVGAVGIGLPAGGDVGSDRGSTEVSLIASRSIGDAWKARLVGTVARSGDTTPGISRFTRVLASGASYAWTARNRNVAEVGLSLSRALTRGAPGRSHAHLALTPPVEWHGITGTVSLSRGLSSGTRETAIGVEASVPLGS